MNHIVNGDVVGEKIKELNNVIVWREMYDFGPFNIAWSKDEWYQNRANFFEQKLSIPSSLFVKNCWDQYNQLTSLSREEEVVLWFEHDRYDQIMLIYLLSELPALDFQKISLVSINEYPSIFPFHGLGQLTTKQLINLLDQRREVTKEQLNEAISAWNAYQSSDSDIIDKWIQTTNHELLFLKQAFNTHKSYFPSLTNGLNEVEALTLSYLKLGINEFTDLFGSVSVQRIDDGLSDLYFAALLNELMIGENPLLKFDSPLPNFQNPKPTAIVENTNKGLDVLEGKQNRMDLIGIDWWVGGVHLKS